MNQLKQVNMYQISLTKTEQFFIKSIADYLHNRKTEYAEGIEWDEVINYAMLHKLEGIEYLQLKSIIPQDRRGKLVINGVTQFNDSKKKAEAAAEIERVFYEKNIPFTIVKGPEVAKLYGEIKERSMGDVDIVVKAHDRAAAAAALTEAGYRNEAVGFYEWTYERDSICIELHSHLQYENVSSEERFNYTEKLWDHASPKDNSSRCELDWNFHLVFLLLHLEKHLENGGVGFRLFLDLVKVCQNTELDLPLLKETLEKLNLFEFTEVCFSLCQRWFDVKMPFSKELSDDFYYSSTKKIISDGLFGLEKDGMNNYALTRIKDKGRLRAIVNRYFPPIGLMLDDPRFGYLRKYPVLLPYAWVRRCIYAVFAGKLSKETVRFFKFFAPKSKVEKRKKLLSEWGIRL